MRGKISKSVGIDFDFGRFSIFITISITVAGSSRLEQWAKKGQFFFEILDPRSYEKFRRVPTTTQKQFECDIMPKSRYLGENSIWLYYEKSKIGRKSKLIPTLFEILPII